MSRVPNVPNAKLTQQLSHVARAKNVAHQALPFALHQLAVLTSHDSGSVLPAMLQHGEGVVDVSSNIALSNHSNQSTHTKSPD